MSRQSTALVTIYNDSATNAAFDVIEIVGGTVGKRFTIKADRRCNQFDLHPDRHALVLVPRRALIPTIINRAVGDQNSITANALRDLADQLDGANRQ